MPQWSDLIRFGKNIAEFHKEGNHPGELVPPLFSVIPSFLSTVLLAVSCLISVFLRISKKRDLFILETLGYQFNLVFP